MFDHTGRIADMARFDQVFAQRFYRVRYRRTGVALTEVGKQGHNTVRMEDAHAADRVVDRLPVRLVAKDEIADLHFGMTSTCRPDGVAGA
jgi:sugar/nucleoside kinase (ribokinase family)